MILKYNYFYLLLSFSIKLRYILRVFPLLNPLSPTSPLGRVVKAENTVAVEHRLFAICRVLTKLIYSFATCSDKHEAFCGSCGGWEGGGGEERMKLLPKCHTSYYYPLPARHIKSSQLYFIIYFYILLLYFFLLKPTSI